MNEFLQEHETKIFRLASLSYLGATNVILEELSTNQLVDGIRCLERTQSVSLSRPRTLTHAFLAAFEFDPEFKKSLVTHSNIQTMEKGQPQLEVQRFHS